ncbi:unnamed protein product [Adineta ricciae]|uniref:Uncharacterized protein n=1 Tax=Adineta ricciae TaxID=249248 RepID=A0A815TQU9_ADIRI|nr:unnamed protein product [Adineta ricciae]
MHTRRDLRLSSKNLLIKKINFCTEYNNPHNLIVVVKSAADVSGIHHERRKFIRESWGLDASQKYEIPPVLFAIGKSKVNTSIHQQRLEVEEEQFHDILQFDFIDNYSNLTLKTVAVLKWFSQQCPNFTLVYTNDDAMINVKNLLIHLQQSNEMAIYGQVREYLEFKRGSSDPIAQGLVTPKSQFASDSFLDYVYGAFVIYPPQVIIPLVREIFDSAPAFWIEDVYVNGIVAEKLKLKRRNLVNILQVGKSYGVSDLMSSVFMKAIAIIDCDVNDQRKIWKNHTAVVLLFEQRKRKKLFLAGILLCFLFFIRRLFFSSSGLKSLCSGKRKVLYHKTRRIISNLLSRDSKSKSTYINISFHILKRDRFTITSLIIILLLLAVLQTAINSTREEQIKHRDIYLNITFTNVTRDASIALKARIRLQSLYEMTSTWMSQVYPFLPFEWSYESSANSIDDNKFCMQNLIIFTTCQKDSPAPILLVLKRLDENCRSSGRIYLILIQVNEAHVDLPFDISIIREYLSFHNNTMPNHIQIHFLTLSKHVQKFTTNWIKNADNGTKLLLDELKMIHRTHLCLPIFPIRLSRQNRMPKQFVVQGTVTHVRKNYSGLSQSLLKSADQLKKTNVTVLIISGLDYYKFPLPVDAKLINQSIVQIRAKYTLDMPVGYQEYYSKIQSSIGMLPLLGNKHYYKSVASSTIPSSIINRTPLVVDEKLLETYQILNKQSVWVKLQNEDDAQAMIRISNSKYLYQEFQERQAALVQIAEESYRHNIQLLKSFEIFFTQSKA